MCFQPAGFRERVVIGSLDGSNVPAKLRARSFRRSLSLPLNLATDDRQIPEQFSSKRANWQRINRTLADHAQKFYHGHHRNATSDETRRQKSPLLVTLPYPVGCTYNPLLPVAFTHAHADRMHVGHSSSHPLTPEHSLSHSLTHRRTLMDALTPSTHTLCHPPSIHSFTHSPLALTRAHRHVLSQYSTRLTSLHAWALILRSPVARQQSCSTARSWYPLWY